MSDAIVNSAEETDADAPRGFSCPGLCFLPGLMMVLNIHLLALTAGLYRARHMGPSWATVGLVAGVVGVFWMMFLSAACVFGVRGAINLLGLVFAILSLVGLLLGIVGSLIWLVWWG